MLQRVQTEVEIDDITLLIDVEIIIDTLIPENILTADVNTWDVFIVTERGNIFVPDRVAEILWPKEIEVAVNNAKCQALINKKIMERNKNVISNR